MNQLLFPKPTKKVKTKKRIAKRGKTPFKKLMIKADDVFSLWIRTRDKFRCYAEDIPEERAKCKGSIQCCHLIERTKKIIRFDEANCNAGCSHHNYIHDQGFHSSPEIYTNWFVKKYGQQKYDDLVTKSIQFREKKWTRQELEEIINKYSI